MVIAPVRFTPSHLRKMRRRLALGQEMSPTFWHRSNMPVLKSHFRVALRRQDEDGKLLCCLFNLFFEYGNRILTVALLLPPVN